MTTTRAPITRTTPPRALVAVINPVMRALLRSPLHRPVSGRLMLLHVRGRRSGTAYDIPVGWSREGEAQTLTAFSNSPWRVNLRGGAEVELTLQGRRQPARASIEEDPERVAETYAGILDRMGWKAGQRRLGITIHVGRMPTREELVEAIRTTGLSVLTFEPYDAR